MQIIPLEATPNQDVTTQVAGGQLRLIVRSTYFGLFVDIIFNGTTIALNRKALDRTTLVPYDYRGLTGRLGFYDRLGTADPTYDGLGSRYFLCYA